MEVNAFLCDAATVRENLLHILGGGITRIWRDVYPSPLGMDLAVQLLLHPSEATERHRIRVLLQDDDGQLLAQLDGEFSVGTEGADTRPGELIAVPLVLNLTGFPIPRTGTYSLELLLDNQHARSLAFVVVDSPPGLPLPG